MAYEKSVANRKSAGETLESSIAIVLAIIASKVSEVIGYQLTGEQLLIIGGSIKIVLARLRNKFKHKKVVN